MRLLPPWAVLLAVFALAVLPSGPGGLVLCIEGGPDGHLSFEGADCCPPAGGEGAESVLEGQGCDGCTDLVLPSAGRRDAPRPGIPGPADLPPRAPAFAAALPAPRAEIPPAVAPAVPADPALPLVLRV